MVIGRSQIPHGISHIFRINLVLAQPTEVVNIEDTSTVKKFLGFLPQSIKVNGHAEPDLL